VSPLLRRQEQKVIHTRYQETISKQMSRLGASYDWDRVAFTLSEVSCFYPGYSTSSLRAQPYVVAVQEAFCQMYEKGLLYRANRLVNWCVYLNTTLSNIEVCSFTDSLSNHY